MWRDQSRVSLILSFIIFGIVIEVMHLYILSLYTEHKFILFWFKVETYWLQMFETFQFRYLIGGLINLTITYFIFLLCRQGYLVMRATSRLKRLKNKEISTKLNQEFSGGVSNLIVIDHPHPTAFTIGFFRPKIVLSTSLVNHLEAEELAAVIFHEAYHQKQRDLLKDGLLSIFAATFPYIPILRWFQQRYSLTQEILADQHAIHKQKNSAFIGSALVKMIKSKQVAPQSFAYSAFAHSSINSRMNKILNPDHIIPFQIPRRTLALSITMVLLLICFCTTQFV